MCYSYLHTHRDEVSLHREPAGSGGLTEALCPIFVWLSLAVRGEHYLSLGFRVGADPCFQTLCTSPASKCHSSSYWLPASAYHLGADCDCVAITTPPGWPEPIPAKTDIATASAARTLSPLMVATGLEAEAGGDGPCWITAAGELMGSAEVSLEVSSPPAARDRERNIHP